VPSLGFLVEAESRLENKRGQKALFGRGAQNVFRVRLDKNFEKHELIVNFEVIFDRYQVTSRYIYKLKNVYTYIFSYIPFFTLCTYLGKRTQKLYYNCSWLVYNIRFFKVV
jgi:hypothetical protein